MIEDNCESLGAKYGKRFAGNFGVAASHSFFYSHHIQTIEGGMITTNDRDICEYSRSLRSHGWNRDSLEKDSFSQSPSAKFKNSFNFPPKKLSLKIILLDKKYEIITPIKNPSTLVT